MWYKFLIIILLIAIKAMFSAADTAITYVSPTKMGKLSKKDRKAKKIKCFIEEKSKFYGTIEVGITMVEFLASVYVAEAFISALAQQISMFDISIQVSNIIAILIVTLVLSYFLLVLGTILPKQLARNYPEKTIYFLVNIVWFISKLNAPFNWLIRATTRFFSKVFNIGEKSKEKLTEKEIKMIITEGKNQGLIDKIEREIVLKALKFQDITVGHIMIKREKIDFLNIEDDSSEILDNIAKFNYTRLPVYKDNIDNIIGVFNIKDLIIDYANEKSMDVDINKHLREIIFVDSHTPISIVFKQLQNKKLSMAIVTDKHKKTLGLVTMEDLLEMLVGKIFDEYDKI